MTDIKPEKQKLKPFEYVWAGWPLIMVAFGGLLGGICGGAAAAINVTIFSSEKSTKYKYGVTFLVSLASILIYFIIIVVLVLIFPSLAER